MDEFAGFKKESNVNKGKRIFHTFNFVLSVFNRVLYRNDALVEAAEWIAAVTSILCLYVHRLNRLCDDPGQMVKINLCYTFPILILTLTGFVLMCFETSAGILSGASVVLQFVSYIVAVLMLIGTDFYYVARYCCCYKDFKEKLSENAALRNQELAIS